jgi:triose-phosphate transporter-like protein
VVQELYVLLDWNMSCAVGLVILTNIRALQVSPVTYSVGSTFKRVVVIFSSILWFGNSITGQVRGEFLFHFSSTGFWILSFACYYAFLLHAHVEVLIPAVFVVCMMVFVWLQGALGMALAIGGVAMYNHARLAPVRAAKALELNLQSQRFADKKTFMV